MVQRLIWIPSSETAAGVLSPLNTGWPTEQELAKSRNWAAGARGEKGRKKEGGEKRGTEGGWVWGEGEEGVVGAVGRGCGGQSTLGQTRGTKHSTAKAPGGSAHGHRGGRHRAVCVCAERR